MNIVAQELGTGATNLVVRELMRARRELAQVNRRLAASEITGKVKPGSQDMAKRTLRLVLGRSADGQEVLSAPVRWEGNAGEFKLHAVPKDNEQMTLSSPSGTVGPTSLARPATFDDDNKPPSRSNKEAVLEYRGKAKVTFGDSPDKHELNEQLKGVVARVGQLEHLAAGQHHVTSKLRQNIESVLPALIPVNAGTQVTAILNKLPDGFDAMIADVQAQAKVYLEKTLQQALAKFQVPTIGDIGSMVDAALQGSISILQGQIADLTAANPAVAKADAIKAEISALGAGDLTDAVQREIAALQATLDKLVAANPAVATAQGLQGQLAGLLAQAAPALDFLEPQKNLAKGQTRSLQLAWR